MQTGSEQICKNISAVRSCGAKSLYFLVYRNTPFLFLPAVVYSCLAQYIEKKQDEKDSRKSRIYFTEKGKSISEDCHKRFAMIQQKLQEYFTKEEQEELDRLLNKFCDCLDEQTEILKKERKERKERSDA